MSYQTAVVDSTGQVTNNTVDPYRIQQGMAMLVQSQSTPTIPLPQGQGMAMLVQSQSPPQTQGMAMLVQSQTAPSIQLPQTPQPHEFVTQDIHQSSLASPQQPGKFVDSNIYRENNSILELGVGQVPL